MNKATIACPECGGNCAPVCGRHPAGCIYDGFTASTSYWLVANDCDRRHDVEQGCDIDSQHT